ncbi:DUF6152 family protein [Sphingomonas sp.]|uniref:DUF6152 family protein n=1 Tax=Sphingomonas sp. TaxID=28214 RepID=UPI0025E49BDD|nr:DUF6152 family protein [Sphingomonas sp.]
MNRKAIQGAVLATVALSASASAHHSFAMFDKAREIELKNVTVKDWQWTSPHTWLFVVAADGTKYSIEGGNPGVMRRMGFAKGTIAAGDKLTVYISPLKNGEKGGAINAVRLPNGKILGERLK